MFAPTYSKVRFTLRFVNLFVEVSQVCVAPTQQRYFERPFLQEGSLQVIKRTCITTKITS